MAASKSTVSGPQPAVPLGYGRADPTFGFGRRLSAGLNERLDGAAEFGAMLVAAIGGRRQLAWAVGLALVAYGFGLVLARPGGDGPGWLAIGAFLIGCVVPVPGKPAGDPPRR